MLKKLLLFSYTFVNASLLIFILCLGSQNLNKRNVLDLGFSKTPPYPNGFILGISLTLGLISGGTTSTLLIKGNQNFKTEYK